MQCKTVILDYHKTSDNLKSADIVDCDFNRPPGESQICQVKSKELMQGNCTKENKYGFRDGTPCVLLKLNRVI